MFLCVNLNDFNSEKLLINNKIRNNIITNSFFYRLYYSDNEFISNGVVIVFKLYDVSFEKYFNKNKLIFNDKKNISNIQKLNLLENELLSALKLENKEKKYLIKEQLDNHFLKIINDRNNTLKNIDNCNIIIKISGIWESKTEYGLTFRCIKTEKQYN
tara:strand:+ start:2375 stop:2848 length:474 start_codon:yes stop_codon:yes gene_type:complete